MRNILQESSVKTPFQLVNSFLELEKNEDTMYGKERSCSETNEQITTVVYLYVIFFRMHEKMQL